MTETNNKPLNWSPDPDHSYQVTRRPDGGMHLIFHRLTPAVLDHWRAFALEHLLNSDRLTRNLYDLRAIPVVSKEAIHYAIEVNSDPAVRNLRVAVLVNTPATRQAVEQIAALSIPGGVELGIFDDPLEAETWLARPLTLLV